MLRRIPIAIAVGAAVSGVAIYLLFRTKKIKKHSGLVVACTGFGKFKGVDKNPTEVLMKVLPSYLKNNPFLDSRVYVDRCKILEVCRWQSFESVAPKVL